jgi:uncharacterized protein YjiS (DUF1127 family)
VRLNAKCDVGHGDHRQWTVKSAHHGVALMTASRGYPPFVASEASAASMLRMTGANTGRQDSDPAVPSLLRVWGRVLQAFDSMLVQPLKTLMRLERDALELRGMDDRDLRDIGVNRIDIAAIHAGIYMRASSNDAERIVFCPKAGIPVTRTLTEHDPGSLTVRWDERPPRIIF